jgi:hypothetical protein
MQEQDGVPEPTLSAGLLRTSKAQQRLVEGYTARPRTGVCPALNVLWEHVSLSAFHEHYYFLKSAPKTAAVQRESVRLGNGQYIRQRKLRAIICAYPYRPFDLTVSLAQ